MYTFLLGWYENVESMFYEKGSIVFGKNIDDPSSFVTKEIISSDGYFPRHAVAWGDGFLFLEFQYSGSNLTLDSRVSIVDTNYNRIQTVLQLKNGCNDWKIFSATPNLAIVFSSFFSPSYYTVDGITWNTLQWSITDITYVYGIYWAVSLPTNGIQHIIASYDGITWKDLGNISNFKGHFVIGNKKLFIWDGNIAFIADLDFFDER